MGVVLGGGGVNRKGKRGRGGEGESRDEAWGGGEEEEEEEGSCCCESCDRRSHCSSDSTLWCRGLNCAGAGNWAWKLKDFGDSRGKSRAIAKCITSRNPNPNPASRNNQMSRNPRPSPVSDDQIDGAFLVAVRLHERALDKGFKKKIGLKFGFKLRLNLNQSLG